MDKFILILKYILLLASVFCLFNARAIVPKKTNISKKNKYIKIIKIVCTCVCVLSLIWIAFF